MTHDATSRVTGAAITAGAGALDDITRQVPCPDNDTITRAVLAAAAPHLAPAAATPAGEAGEAGARPLAARLARLARLRASAEGAGELVVTAGDDGPRIDRADPPIWISGELVGQWVTGGAPPGITLRLGAAGLPGAVVTITGVNQTVRYQLAGFSPHSQYWSAVRLDSKDETAAAGRCDALRDEDAGHAGVLREIVRICPAGHIRAGRCCAACAAGGAVLCTDCDAVLPAVLIPAAAFAVAAAATGCRPETATRIGQLETALAREQRRAAGLEALAREVIGSYRKTSDGYRGRAGQVQISKWTAALEGTAP
jgi:hypothetical protein